MGAWGITVRQSDDGLDLLDTIVAGQLRKVDFSAFNVSEAIALLNQTIQEEIEQYRQKPPSKITDLYISETLMHNFTNAAILVAECLYGYYQTGELVVYDYVGENYDPVEYHIKNFIVKIPSIGLTVGVYEGTGSTPLLKGAGHFEDTSIWLGNVCLAGVRPDRA